MGTPRDRNWSTIFPPAQELRSGGVRRGIVIGVSTYRDPTIDDLPGAAPDARAMYALMIDPDCGLFSPEDVELLVDEGATRREIEKAFEDLERRAGPEDDVWIYFAGHGLPLPGVRPGAADTTIWAAHDTDPRHAKSTGLPPGRLKEYLDLPARRVVSFLDCCHAETGDPTRGAAAAEDLLAGFTGEGTFTVCASRSGQRAIEDGEHGVFTRCLLEGLAGAADANQDGVVDAGELWAYLRDAVPRQSRALGRVQDPVGRLEEKAGVMALTVNRARAGMARRIMALIGLGPDRLTTDEASLALRLLQVPPEGPEEQAVAQVLPHLCEGTLPVEVFRVVTKAALALRPAPATAPTVASPATHAGPSAPESSAPRESISQPSEDAHRPWYYMDPVFREDLRPRIAADRAIMVNEDLGSNHPGKDIILGGIDARRLLDVGAMREHRFVDGDLVVVTDLPALLATGCGDLLMGHIEEIGVYPEAATAAALPPATDPLWSIPGYLPRRCTEPLREVLRQCLRRQDLDAARRAASGIDSPAEMALVQRYLLHDRDAATEALRSSPCSLWGMRI
ncbi:MAG: caspase family protein [Pseudomonadota bacterium]